MKVIVISGQAQVGKNTFINFCKESDYDVHDFSTIDYVKEVAKQIGWNGEKDNRGRRLLSDLKDCLTRYDNIPFKKVVSEIDNVLYQYDQFEQPTDKLIFFIQSREPADIDKWVEKYNAKTLLIRREVEEEYDNHADKEVFDYDYDYVYSNTHDLDIFKRDAINFINYIGSRP